MYAIVKIAGFDYKVAPGDKIRVPFLAKEEEGNELEFSEVKLLCTEEDLDLAPKALVKAKVLGHNRHKKIIVFKFKKRKGYRRKLGHRAKFTNLEVTEIVPIK